MDAVIRDEISGRYLCHEVLMNFVSPVIGSESVGVSAMNLVSNVWKILFSTQ